MFEIEKSNEKIGAYLAKLVDKKYESRRKFCREYISLDGGDAKDQDEIRKMANRLSQIIKGSKAIQTYDLPIFTELLGVTCEEILTAGKYVVRNARRMTNYDIAFSTDENEWEKYIHREDKLILNCDEYGKTVIDYALECKNYNFLKYLMKKKYIWFVSDNKENCSYSWCFGAGTSVKSREVRETDALQAKMMERMYLRSKMIALAIDNDDFETLTELRAREIPSLYMPLDYGIVNIDCKKYYDADMVEHIAETDNEKIIEYFTDEFEIQTKYDKKYTFIFPYISELIDLLLKRKSKYADIVLKKTIAHNKYAYEKLKKLIKDDYEAYRKEQYCFDEEELAYTKMYISTGFRYQEEDNCIHFHPVLNCRNLSQMELITTNIICVKNHSENEVTRHLIEELNEYYKKILELKENPIGDLI